MQNQLLAYFSCTLKRSLRYVIHVTTISGIQKTLPVRLPVGNRYKNIGNKNLRGGSATYEITKNTESGRERP